MHDMPVWLYIRGYIVFFNVLKFLLYIIYIIYIIEIKVYHLNIRYVQRENQWDVLLNSFQDAFYTSKYDCSDINREKKSSFGKIVIKDFQNWNY